MSVFAVPWLDLREPADARARNAGLLAVMARHFEGRARITVTDLGCGTGATMRAVGAHLPLQQNWHMVDYDSALLNAIEQRCHGLLQATQTITWQSYHADLQKDLESIMALPSDLVTLSAFLDLVSFAWLERLANAAASRQRPIYAALIYNGLVACEPADPFDAQVLRVFNAHQRRDKGFGYALGPLAAAQMAEQLAVRGFTVRRADADWMLDGKDGALQEELMRGWYQAASEQKVLDQCELSRWLARRLEAVRAGQSRLTVGHCDIWAYPHALGPNSRSKSTS